MSRTLRDDLAALADAPDDLCRQCGHDVRELLAAHPAPKVDEAAHGPWDKSSQRYEDGCKEDRPHPAPPVAHFEVREDGTIVQNVALGHDADDDLRTALTELRDMYLVDADDQSPAAIAANIDALLWAYPAPEDDQGGCYICNGSGILDGGDMQDDRRCGCTPDETMLRDLILKVDDEGGWSNIFPDEATALAAEIAARLRGEGRG